MFGKYIKKICMALCLCIGSHLYSSSQTDQASKENSKEKWYQVVQYMYQESAPLANTIFRGTSDKEKGDANTDCYTISYGLPTQTQPTDVSIYGEVYVMTNYGNRHGWYNFVGNAYHQPKDFAWLPTLKYNLSSFSATSLVLDLETDTPYTKARSTRDLSRSARLVLLTKQELKDACMAPQRGSLELDGANFKFTNKPIVTQLRYAACLDVPLETARKQEDLKTIASDANKIECIRILALDYNMQLLLQKYWGGKETEDMQPAIQGFEQRWRETTKDKSQTKIPCLFIYSVVKA